MEITIFNVQFELDKKMNGSASQLRGYFSTKFNEYLLLHHHKPTGFLYQYPCVQYKIINGVPTVIGINEGTDVLIEIFNEYDSILLGRESYKIKEKKVIYHKQEFGITDHAQIYNFLTPWVALNKENYYKYYGLKDSFERNELLSKTLIGNILSLSKTLGYEVSSKIECGVSVQPKKVSIKKTNLMAFNGSFQTNFNIPDFLGLGKSVSRGYGTVQNKKNG